MHVKKGDTVYVIAGDAKGTVGEIKSVRTQEQRVVVGGVNLGWKTRKGTQQNPKGERVQVERPIHVSNVRKATPQDIQKAKAAGKAAQSEKSQA